MIRALFAAFVLAGLASTSSVCTAADRTRPNVILILIDDMGWTDLGCHGSKFYETPHIDRLAASGMRFTQGYSACTVCSPTRAAVMTGKYPARLHITDWIEGHKRPFAKLKVPDWTKHLPHDTLTMAEVFQANGYATCHVGKWHLGGEEFWPTTHGFDLNIGGNHRGQPPSYFFPYERDNIKLPGLAAGKDGEYLTDRLTDEAITVHRRHKDKPVLSLPAPLHRPHAAASQGRPDRQVSRQGRGDARPAAPKCRVCRDDRKPRRRHWPPDGDARRIETAGQYRRHLHLRQRRPHVQHVERAAAGRQGLGL